LRLVQGLAGILLALLLAGCQMPGKIPPSTNGDGDSAASETALQMRAEASAHYAAAIIHALNEEATEAAQEYDAATRKDPDNEALVLEVSRRLVQMRQVEAARDIVERAAARPKPSAELLARLGFIYSQLGQTTNAIAANRRALAARPEAFAIRQNLFLNYVQSRNSAAALAVLDETARLPKISSDQLTELAGLYGTFAQQFPTQRETANARAYAVLRRVDESRLIPVQARLKLADRYFLLGDNTNSERLYLKLAEDYTDVPALREHIRGRLVDVYLRQQDQTNAIAQLETIIRENPSNEQAYYSLGSLASERKDWSNAVVYLEKAVLFGPKMEQAHYDLAAAQLAVDDPGGALKTLDNARKLFPNSFVVEYLEGMARSQKKDFALAAHAFGAAERIAKGREVSRLNHVFYFQYGAACERSGDYTRAVELFEKCLGLQPDFSEALNYLGYMWAERGEHLERARDLIARALKAEPDNAAYLDSMGWVLFKLKQPEEALAYMLRAVKAESPVDATLLDHLGDIYAALNQHVAARDAWTRSLATEPNETVKKKLEAIPAE
jgi:tetratricopeptide (TPR) repeat protein